MESEQLDPETAPPNRSIWKGTDRKTLEHQTQALAAKLHVAGRRTYAATATSKRNDQYPIASGVEKSLADDFAFIAACEPRVNFVSAATVEVDPIRRSLTVKLAANEGVVSHVREKFDEIIAVLRKHASKDITRDSCQNQLLQLIVQLNRNRILGRLESTKFVRPAHMVKIRESLPTRLRAFISRNITIPVQRQKRQEMNKLNHDVSNFETAFAGLEDGDAVDDILHLGRTVEYAFRLTENGVQLPSRLRALNCPESLLDVRDIREVGKVANYWRISRHLTLCASRFRSYFANAECRPLSNYQASLRLGLANRQFVHAEIQLLVHHELEGRHPLPRVIGVSKEACFLCDSFLRAHGRFSFAGAHRQMFPQWTVPDLEEYTLSTVQNFRRILAQVAAEVGAEYLRAREKVPWRPFPLQSAINLNVVHLSTPSTSTTHAQRSTNLTSSTGTIKSRSSTPKLVSTNIDQGVHSQQHPDEGAKRDQEHFTREIAESQVSGDDAKVSQEILTNVEVKQLSSDPIDWIRTFGCFSNLSIDRSLASQRKRFTGGSIVLEPAHGDGKQRTIYLADLPTEDGLVLANSGDGDRKDSPYEMSFVLIGDRGQSVRIRCQWHT